MRGYIGRSKRTLSVGALRIVGHQIDHSQINTYWKGVPGSVMNVNFVSPSRDY